MVFVCLCLTYCTERMILQVHHVVENGKIPFFLKADSPVITAALSTTAEIRKQPQCPLVDKWIHPFQTWTNPVDQKELRTEMFITEVTHLCGY